MTSAGRCMSVSMYAECREEYSRSRMSYKNSLVRGEHMHRTLSTLASQAFSTKETTVQRHTGPGIGE